MSRTTSIPTTAQAVRIVGETAIDALRFDTVPVAQPRQNQVLVAIKAVSLNYRDLLVATGKYGRNLKKPVVIASDGTGEVIAVGEGVSGFKPGDRVAGKVLPELGRWEVRTGAYADRARRRYRWGSHDDSGVRSGGARASARTPQLRGRRDAALRGGHGLAGAGSDCPCEGRRHGAAAWYGRLSTLPKKCW